MADEPTKEELAKQAADLGIEGRSSMSKDELAKAVHEADSGESSDDESSDEVTSSMTGALQKTSEVDNSDNSLLDDDEAYVGVTGEYRNAAYPEQYGPRNSEDKELGETEKLMKALEVDRAEKGQEIGRQGHKVDLVHPSERKNASDEAYKNRVKLEEQAREEARQEVNK